MLQRSLRQYVPGEVFAYYSDDRAMAGRRAAGPSLWNPGAEWLTADPTEPTLSFLPSRLWMIGLGNLGQAFAWLLACLPYGDRSQINLVLQDIDRLSPSNESTSLLSFKADVGRRKAHRHIQAVISIRAAQFLK